MADDAVLFVNGINLGKSEGPDSASVDGDVSVDGKSLSDCAAESSIHVICETSITAGAHKITVQVNGHPKHTKRLVFRVAAEASNWSSVPADQRLWCVSITKATFALMPKAACWDVENAR